MSLSIGLTYYPLIHECLVTLRLWCKHLDQAEITTHLKKILPFLDTFLLSSGQFDTGTGYSLFILYFDYHDVMMTVCAVVGIVLLDS